jgi:hypothetical protein
MNLKQIGLAIVACAIPFAALAGSPHFVAVNASLDGNTVTVSGKIAGLGNETQVHIEVSGTAACINPGGNDPKAANKETFSVAGDFPVQNGKALFMLELEATFQPNCLPPMTLVWTDIIVSDAEHSLTFGPLNF